MSGVVCTSQPIGEGAKLDIERFVIETEPGTPIHIIIHAEVRRRVIDTSDGIYQPRDILSSRSGSSMGAHET